MKILLMAILYCIFNHSASTLAIGTDSTLCETGIKVQQSVVIEEGGNVLVIYNEDIEIIFALAFDFNRDGVYEVLLFDINGNGQMDMELQGGQATAEEVMTLYCLYQQLPMSQFGRSFNLCVKNVTY